MSGCRNPGRRASRRPVYVRQYPAEHFIGGTFYVLPANAPENAGRKRVHRHVWRPMVVAMKSRARKDARRAARGTP